MKLAELILTLDGVDEMHAHFQWKGTGEILIKEVFWRSMHQITWNWQPIWRYEWVIGRAYTTVLKFLSRGKIQKTLGTNICFFMFIYIIILFIVADNNRGAQTFYLFFFQFLFSWELKFLVIIDVLNMCENVLCFGTLHSEWKCEVMKHFNFGQSWSAFSVGNGRAPWAWI